MLTLLHSESKRFPIQNRFTEKEEKEAINIQLAADCTATPECSVPNSHPRNWNADQMPNRREGFKFPSALPGKIYL